MPKAHCLGQTMQGKKSFRRSGSSVVGCLRNGLLVRPHLLMSGANLSDCLTTPLRREDQRVQTLTSEISIQKYRMLEGSTGGREELIIDAASTVHV